MAFLRAFPRITNLTTEVIYKDFGRPSDASHSKNAYIPHLLQNAISTFLNYYNKSTVAPLGKKASAADLVSSLRYVCHLRIYVAYFLVYGRIRIVCRLSARIYYRVHQSIVLIHGRFYRACAVGFSRAEIGCYCPRHSRPAEAFPEHIKTLSRKEITGNDNNNYDYHQNH